MEAHCCFQNSSFLDLRSFNNYATLEHKQVNLNQSRYTDLQLNPMKHEFHGTDSVRK